jgi:hypothetical protein
MDMVENDFVIAFRFSQWNEVDYEARIAPTPGDLETMLSELRASGVDVFHASARRFWIPEWPGSDLGIAGWTWASFPKKFSMTSLSRPTGVRRPRPQLEFVVLKSTQ